MRAAAPYNEFCTELPRFLAVPLVLPEVLRPATSPKSRLGRCGARGCSTLEWSSTEQEARPSEQEGQHGQVRLLPQEKSTVRPWLRASGTTGQAQWRCCRGSRDCSLGCSIRC